jgi:hypothetical protein
VNRIKHPFFLLSTKTAGRCDAEELFALQRVYNLTLAVCPQDDGKVYVMS